MMLRIGQKVTRTPRTIETMAFGDGRAVGTVLRPKPLSGLVVYLHPKGRFHVVEFTNAKGVKMRETFDGVN